MNRNITSVILIVLAIGIYVTFTNDRWAEIKAVRAVNDQYTEAIANADRLIKVRNEVLDDFNKISAYDADRLDKMVPNTVDNIRLLIDLNNVALRRGFTLKNIKASASSAAVTRPVTAVSASPAAGTAIIPPPALDTVSISFSINAPYQQFIEFLRDLEANLRVMDVTRLSMKGSDTGIYEFNVELKTYYLRQQ